MARLPTMAGCILESDADTMEIALKRRMEDLISEGKIDEAENVEDTLSNLDNIPVCQ